MGKLKQSKMLKAKMDVFGIFRQNGTLLEKMPCSQRTKKKRKEKKMLLLVCLFVFTTDIFFKLERVTKAS